MMKINNNLHPRASAVASAKAKKNIFLVDVDLSFPQAYEYSFS